MIGGVLNCPHCSGYLLDSIKAATTAALATAKDQGIETELKELTEDVEMVLDDGLPTETKERIAGFTAAEGSDPLPPDYHSTVNPGDGSGMGGASGSQAWAKSGGPNMAPPSSQLMSPPRQGDAARQAAAPY